MAGQLAADLLGRDRAAGRRARAPARRMRARCQRAARARGGVAQAGRIEPAQADLVVYLVGAAAGVGGGGDAAVAGDEAVEGGAGARQALAEGDLAEVEDVGGLLGVDLADGAQHEGDARRAVEGRQHRLGATEEDLLLEEGGVGAGEGGGLDGVGRLREVALGQRLEAHLPAGALGALAAGAQEVAASHAVGPGGDGAFAAEGGELGEDEDQDLLGGVGGVLAVMEETVGQAREPRLERGQELLEGGALGEGVEGGALVRGGRVVRGHRVHRLHRARSVAASSQATTASLTWRGESSCG